MISIFRHLVEDEEAIVIQDCFASFSIRQAQRHALRVPRSQFWAEFLILAILRRMLAVIASSPVFTSPVDQGSGSLPFEA